MIMRKAIIGGLLYGAVASLVSCVDPRLKPDESMLAFQAKDHTVFIEGCGNQSIVGFTYCRKKAGDASNDSIYLHVPPALCGPEDTSPCVRYEIYYPNGEPSFGKEVPRGTTKVQIPWAQLIKRNEFSKGDRGNWSMNVWVKWIDQDEREQESLLNGEIILRVYDADYTPLDAIDGNPNFVWTWVDDGNVFKMTTAGRAYTGK